MKLLSLACTGVRGLADGTYRFTDARSSAPLDVAIVTGGPSSGKTSLLEAIAAVKEATGPYGAPPDPKRLRRSDATDARIVATWLLSDAERDHARVERAEQTVTWDLCSGSVRGDAEPGLRRLFAEHSRDPGCGKLEYFPADRRLAAGGHPAFTGASKESATRLRATRAPEKYACVLEGLRALALEEAARTTQAVRDGGVALRGTALGVLDPFEKAVAAMLPDLRLDEIDLAGGGPRFLRRTREPATLDELSDGERQGVLLALAFRYFGLNGSLVLIDEPELHVHAAHRVRWLHALVGLGEGNQIIAATGSAEIVGAAAPGQVIDLSAHAR